MNFVRHDGRTSCDVRPLTVKYDPYGHSDASVLIELGHTIVLVGITLQNSVPPFLKGQKTGWLSAEYSMIPHATHQRSQRETSQAQRNSRSVEISRLIGRCLRASVDLSGLGERSILVDCDVLQADGGTRVASITAASLALKIAVGRWQVAGILERNIFQEQIAAISVGVVNNVACVDLSYIEDSDAQADFNFVMSEQGNLIEIQGTCEKNPIAWTIFDQLKVLAQNGVASVFQQLALNALPEAMPSVQATSHQGGKNISKQAFFSLANRINK